MRISHTYNFVFFCNPKTGSESVRKMLDPYSDVISTNYRRRTTENPFYSHMTPLESREIFAQFGWEFEQYTKFVFVRNPWARLVSLYEMIFKKGVDESRKPEFADWLYTIKPYGTGAGGEDWKRWRKFGSYSLDHYAGDGSGKLLVDKVIRLEDIDTELLPFLQQLKLPQIEKQFLPHLNKRSRNKPYTDYYTQETQGLVAQRYQYDIMNFGYRFGD